jgi:hypothetical protein
MKVPRSFSISGVSDMASLRVREVRWCGFGAFKRESSAGFVLANPWAASANQRGVSGASSPTHGLAPITRGACASQAGLAEPDMPFKDPKDPTVRND